MMRISWIARRIGLTVSLLAGCGGPVPREEGEPRLIDTPSPAGFPERSAVQVAPADNELTEARAQLGKRLFFDTRLSRDESVSCGTCHRQEFAFADPAAQSAGVEQRQGTRNAPALVNLAWAESLFWDGRAQSLEEQATQPIEDPNEMDLPLPEAVARVAADSSYVAAFELAYGGAPNAELLSKALASFVRTLVSGNSAYDRHLRGDDSAFGQRERAGEALFFGERGECFHCHPGGRLTNEGFFNNGTYTAGGDAGRQLLTQRAGDIGKFKVPGLRNVEHTAPYMHDGSVPTLEAVIEQYDQGGRGDITTDPQIKPLGLTDEDKLSLLAFLRSLSDPEFLADDRYRP